MATTNVPIEIVLQDPNNPIVPTPDSDGGSDNTNSNIAVPNTATGEGHTTMDGSSNNTSNIFTGPTATVSIVSVVILALALSGIITLLIHKYYKNRKTKDNKEQSKVKAKATKQEHLAMAATSTMAVLAATVLVGQLLMTTTNAATSEGTELSTPDKIQIIANRYDDVTIVASTKAVSYATTDTTFGYKIFMSMAGDNANLYLDGDTSSEKYFTATENAGLDDNSWGYSLNGKANYSAMPLASDPLMAQQNINAVSDEEFTVYYTMKADKDMPFGVYSGEIAYDIEGYKGFPASLTTMQGMTSAICDAVYTPSGAETVVPTATLKDTRDNKTYEIAKLADGNCWMTQNLDLQAENLKQGVVLDSTNTDNPASGFTLPASQITVTDDNRQWYAYDDETGELLPSSVDTAHVYDLAGDETEYKYCLDYRGYCAEYGDVIPSELLGNLYNWYSATAGTGTYSTGSTEEGPFEATGSICPAGWRLPNNSNSYEATDYSTLLSLYGITKSATDSNYISTDKNAIFKAPLSLLTAGYYSNGVSSVGYYGYLWSSLAYSGDGARLIYFSTSGYVHPWNGNIKYGGYSVRCVAR